RADRRPRRHRARGGTARSPPARRRLLRPAALPPLHLPPQRAAVHGRRLFRHAGRTHYPPAGTEVIFGWHHTCPTQLLRKLPLSLPRIGLGVQTLDDDLQEFAGAAGQSVDAFRLGRTRHEWGEDVLAAERDRQAGEGERVQQLVMVDFAEAGAAVFVLEKRAVVLDAEAADLVDALLDVGDRVHAEIIHHIARVIIDFYPFVCHLANNLGAGRAGAGLAAVLLHDDPHTLVASN